MPADENLEESLRSLSKSDADEILRQARLVFSEGELQDILQMSPTELEGEIQNMDAELHAMATLDFDESLQELLRGDDDERLLRRVQDDLAQRALTGGDEALTHAQLAFSDLYHIQAVWNNGGLDYFCETTERFAETLAAFELVGWPEGAQQMRDAMSVFPSGMPHVDWQTRMDFVWNNKEIFDDAPQDWCRDDNLFPLLANFVRQRPDQFPPPAVETP